MDARLAKVRQRKQQKVGSDPTNEEEAAVNLTDFDFDSTDKKGSTYSYIHTYRNFVYIIILC